MIVETPRVESAHGVTRFEAQVDWEDRQREPFEVFFGVNDELAHRVDPNPDAFRIPAAIAALHDNESRISGGGPICPALFNGLANSLSWLARWSESETQVPLIDMPKGCAHPTPGPGGAAAAFVSGGVDSSALLAANHEAYEPGHPLRVSVGIVIVGIQRSRWVRSTLKEQLDAATAEMAEISEGLGLDIVPVATNLQAIERRGPFWAYEYQGAALAGVGHLFSKGVSNLNIASTWEIKYLDRWGSHPLLDPGYGHHSLRIWHELAHLGRLEKTRLVVGRPELFNSLNVCNNEAAGDDNCGRCEKCLRTMLALEALGVFDSTPTFEQARIRARDLSHIRILDPGLEGEYLELVGPLREVGRADLAKAIERRIREGRFLRQRAIRRLRVVWSLGKKRAARAIKRKEDT